MSCGRNCQITENIRFFVSNNQRRHRNIIKNLLRVIFILCLVGNVLAYTEWTDNAVSDHYWMTFENWSDGIPSGLTESVSIKTLTEGERGPIITSSMTGLLAKNIRVEPPAGQTTVITITGGSLTLQEEVWLIAGTSTGRAELEMIDGSLTIGTELRIGNIGTDGGHLQLDGGVVETSTLYIRDNGSIDITGNGVLEINSDVTSQIQGYIGTSAVTAYGGASEVLIDYDNGTDKTTVTAVEPEMAHDPSPFDTETGVAIDATLSWIAGTNTDSHDVYFGTDELSVNNANTSSPEFVRNQTATSIAVADYNPSGLLEQVKAYYWRIDKIVGGIPVKGEVWSFTTDSFVKAGHSVQNPVIYKLADSGAMKYNGEYYTMGTGSSGQMLSSENLINWGQRTHVFSMDNDWATGEAGEDDEIHACDVQYVDGVFHLYWSVNRSDIGVRHIGHATNTSGPLGPYVEPVTSTWFADYIDAHFFIDDDGSPYFYTVKFPSGNVCYGQAMLDPWTRTGSDNWLIDAANGTWETADGTRINEGPEVIKYRDKYYMLYAANATWSPSYAVGCVESDGPLAFSGSDKYPDAVLQQAGRGGHSVTHIGQPCLLRGPNGFEWWVIYFAKYDESIKSQAVDRVLFFDRQLYVTGPSSNLAAYTGLTYTPPPAAPTLGDLFNEGTTLGAYWDIKTGTWDISGGQARQTQTDGSDNKAIIKSATACNYLVESGVKLIDEYPLGKKAGVTAYYKDADNWMVVALDQENGSWYYNKVDAGTSTVTGYPLPGSFDYNVYHTIRVTKNNTDFYVLIDDRPAPGNPEIATSFSDAGLPGLYTQEARANFDGFIYTIGWDEYDGSITGWGNADSGTTPTGTWSIGSSGIEATDGSTTNRTYKGDLLTQYEFMTQVTRTSTVPADADPHTMGIYAVYIDSNNWLAACIDLVNDCLKVYGLQNGVNIGDQEVSVEHADSYNLRVIKRDDATRIFIDGELKIIVSLGWGPSQVGLRTEKIEARYNGITLFGLGSQYGDSLPVNDALSDNFDDSIFSSKWQQVSIHSDDVAKHDHSTLPDIVINESDRCLRFSGCEKGDDDSSWYGRALKYTEPVYGNSICEFDFDSLMAYSDYGTVQRAAIGLRIWKDSDNWFEVKQTDDDDGDKLQTVRYNNGVKTTSSVAYSITSGNLKIRFNNTTGLVNYYVDDIAKGVVSVSGMMDNEYYVYITAYTSNTDNRILCNVDNFKITTSNANFNNDWTVDLLDFAVFTQQWLNSDCSSGNAWCQRCDLDEDGVVDVGDLSEFTENWLWGLVD